MKRISVILLLALYVLGANAQHVEDMTYDELVADLRWVRDCVIDKTLPKPRVETITLSTGKDVRMLAHSDYEWSSFVSVDELLEDSRLLISSPYMWQMKHQKNNNAIMDGTDLSNWEVNSFDQIAKSYFKDCVSTYHIAAHGLISETGSASNKIKIGGEELDASETAELIIKSMQDGANQHENFVEDMPFVVVVHCCHTADGEDNFASQLSKALAEYLPNISVVGAPDVVRCEMKDGKYTEIVTTKNEAEMENPEKLRWKVYKNGENTNQGQYDYLETVAAIQESH